ncbi:hypothetical protein HMPREF0201_00980 [Cedecea davisae DSM 4568]|uniref:Uncharacterized protein n=1 Tax=Cedecea davisae DSM 4568 TaxID=566551 RepID=S3J0U5_9ENTR|nr:hypothetical protein HMPREF0201_00980 [Cedecea davisae DSM 4568]
MLLDLFSALMDAMEEPLVKIDKDIVNLLDSVRVIELSLLNQSGTAVGIIKWLNQKNLIFIAWKQNTARRRCFCHAESRRD